MAKLETIKRVMAESFEYVVKDAKGQVLSLMSKKTFNYVRSFGSEAEALKGMAGLKSTKGYSVVRQKKVKQKTTQKKYTAKEAKDLMAYYGRKSGAYTGD